MMTIYVIFVLLVFSSILWWLARRLRINKWLVIGLFGVKILSSLVFLEVYAPNDDGSFHFSDSYAYFSEGKVLHSVWEKSRKDYLKLFTGIGATQELEINYFEDNVHQWSHKNKTYNDNENMIKLNSLIHFYSKNIALIHSATFGFFALIGFMLLTLFVRKFSSISTHWVLPVFVLLPSTLFWTSGILKESMVVLGIGCSLALFLNFRKVIRYGLFTVGILLMLFFKPYIFIFMLPGIIIGLIFYFSPTQKLYLPLSIVLVSLIAIFSIPKIRDSIIYYTAKQQFDVVNISKGGLYFDDNGIVKKVDLRDLKKIRRRFHQKSRKHFFIIKETIEVQHIVFEERMSPKKEVLFPSKERYFFNPKLFMNGANSYVELKPFDSVKGLIQLFPKSIWNAFIRPYPWDSGRFTFLAFLETIFIVSLLVFAVLRRGKLQKPQKTILFVSVLFSIVMLYIVGLTTANFGSIIRYRIPAHWALVVVCFILMGSQKNKKGVNLGKILKS